MIFFRVGFIGCVAGFLGWFTWFLLVLLNLISYRLGYGYSSAISGIFFQSGVYSIIVYGFFLASFLLGSFACFGLRIRYNSVIALLCGFLHLAGFAVMCYSIASFYLLRSYIWMTANFLAILNIGMLVWGATLLEVRKSLPYPKLALLSGAILIIIAILTLTWFWQVSLYWGIEFWFVLLGGYIRFACLTLRLFSTSFQGNFRTRKFKQNSSINIFGVYAKKEV